MSVHLCTGGGGRVHPFQVLSKGWEMGGGQEVWSLSQDYTLPITLGTDQTWPGEGEGRGERSGAYCHPVWTTQWSPPLSQVWSSMIWKENHDRYCLVILMTGCLVHYYSEKKTRDNHLFTYWEEQQSKNLLRQSDIAFICRLFQAKSTFDHGLLSIGKMFCIVLTWFRV